MFHHKFSNQLYSSVLFGSDVPQNIDYLGSLPRNNISKEIKTGTAYNPLWSFICRFICIVNKCQDALRYLYMEQLLYDDKMLTTVSNTWVNATLTFVLIPQIASQPSPFRNRNQMNPVAKHT